MFGEAGRGQAVVALRTPQARFVPILVQHMIQIAINDEQPTASAFEHSHHSRGGL